MNRSRLEAFRDPSTSADNEGKETEKREREREESRTHIRQLSDGEILQRYEG
jgi:hypothetical protein